MNRRLTNITILVTDYDEAINFYTGVLGFRLVEDTYIEAEDKRWVVVSPGDGCGLVLGKATTADQEAAVGAQTGDRVGFFLGTDDFWRDYEAFKAAGVKFVREVNETEYGTVSVFKDLYGNCWDLIQYKSK